MRFIPLLAIMLAGCSLIPAYLRPALPVSSAWPMATPRGAIATDIPWRGFFTDSAMQNLTALSLANNRDLRVAVLNVAVAQAQYRVERASLSPAIDANADYSRSRIPAGFSAAPNAVTVSEYSLGVGTISWELDLFGRIRSQAQAAQETAQADADTSYAAQISLIAEINSEYLTWLADRDSLAIAQTTAETQADSLRLIQMDLNGGIGTALDVAQAQSTLYTAQVRIAQYTGLVAQDMDELVLLAGAPIPDSLLAQMNAETGLDAVPAFPELGAGLPADLLQRRPDILSAEYNLLAANANIGAARAAFFPEITLTASGGVESTGLSSLFDAAHGDWLFAPSLSLPIFNAGQNFANLDIAKLQKRIEIATYESTIQSAFHDTADALSARATYQDELVAQQLLVGADTRNDQLSEMLFRAGTDGYLSVLVAQDALLSARLALVGVKLAALQNTITLYKSFGGGWQSEAP